MEAASTVFDFAISYLRAGLSIIPISRDGTKSAAIKWGIYGSGRKDETTGKIIDPPRLMTEEEARRFFECPRPPGIAIACGKTSGNLEVIDFDAKAQSNIPEWVFAVEAERPGLLDKLVQIQTPRHEYARHFWYRCREIEIPGNQKLAVDPKSAGEKTLIETRGEGGYALVPGSPPECHDTGRLYVHVSGPELINVGIISSAERDTLIRCAAMLDLKERLSEHESAYLSNGGLLPGTDFINRGPDWPAILEPHGWVCARRSGNITYWRRPGKEKGWSATTGICTSKNGSSLFAVFSSNAHPFSSGENGKNCSCYNKFSAYTLLNFSGDFKLAAQGLREQGFGTAGPKIQSVERLEAVKKEQAEALAAKEDAERRIAETKKKEKEIVTEVKDADKKQQEEKIRVGFAGLGFEFINNEWFPGSWHIVIVRSDPVTYKLFAPFLKKSGVPLNDDQFDSPTMVHKAVLRATGNICLADRPQAWESLWNGYKNIRAMKAKLLDSAMEEDAPAEVKRSVVVAQWLFKILQRGRVVKDRTQIDGHGAIYHLEDGSVVFDFTHVWTDGSKSEDKIKRPEMSHLLDDLGRDHCWRGKKMFDVLNKRSLDILESMLKPDQQPRIE